MIVYTTSVLLATLCSLVLGGITRYPSNLKARDVEFEPEEVPSNDTSIAEPLERRAGQRGVVTTYWDCCKPSCAWGSRAHLQKPVKACDAGNNIFGGASEAESGCTGGNVFTCASHAPIIVNPNLAYFTAAHSDAGEYGSCCKCFSLDFLNGKKAIVQVTNSGSELNHGQFDLLIPGGGGGQYSQGCMKQYLGSKLEQYGKQYGGVGSVSGCGTLPPQQQAGCRAGFGFLNDNGNPPITFSSVACPADLNAMTGCAGA